MSKIGSIYKQFGQIRIAAEKANLLDKPEQLGEALIQKGVLTNWQVKQLKAGLERIFCYGSSEKLCLAGSGFLLGLDALAMTSGQINIVPGQKFYGMEIDEWRTPFGVIKVKTHPLFSYDETTRNMGILLEPKELGYKFITDTTFYGESSAKAHPEGYGQRRVDGTNEEYLTECGLEFGLPQKCAVLNGVGLANIV